ncbi:hypothetical protein FOB72_17260 (plasmid) [Cupriavidus pauculus]|uniref:DUF3322 and DUF2220 domain-containing protein n=1 Tax=Cupriavidus pauculus TaxID=82633 RepID=A0A5P2H7F3_9BURK|nr:Wadjet anti-phage system protein JetD domain-containing protein [Cupriavidus pauculus]QET03916.1 hypothetical protein FOB72_17260 [Cupriavidus pauculus]
MKSPVELGARLARAWQSAETRVARLLSADAWPIRLAIGRPDAKTFSSDTLAVKQHIELWRSVEVGVVQWETVTYRAGREPVEIPRYWEIRTPTEWVGAAADETILREFQRLGEAVQRLDADFHALVVRQRRWAVELSEEELAKVGEVALTLGRGMAAGRPIRAIAVCGIDSKFIERNRTLLCQMLDLRFDGLVSEIGLEAFLGAIDEDDRWLLVVPLTAGILPFRQQRIRASELEGLPGTVKHVVIVENERALYQLPTLPHAVAILGAGLSLNWVRDPWLDGKRVAYWGDMDTWGLTMLATVRRAIPDLASILMAKQCFDRYSELSVREPVPAGDSVPAGLTMSEAEFYQFLLLQERGRLEQEFLPSDAVHTAFWQWYGGESNGVGS